MNDNTGSLASLGISTVFDSIVFDFSRAPDTAGARLPEEDARVEKGW